jgi:hypothetical protein
LSLLQGIHMGQIIIMHNNKTVIWKGVRRYTLSDHPCRRNVRDQQGISRETVNILWIFKNSIVHNHKYTSFKYDFVSVQYANV